MAYRGEIRSFLMQYKHHHINTLTVCPGGRPGDRELVFHPVMPDLRIHETRYRVVSQFEIAPEPRSRGTIPHDVEKPGVGAWLGYPTNSFERPGRNDRAEILPPRVYRFKGLSVLRLGKPQSRCNSFQAVS